MTEVKNNMGRRSFLKAALLAGGGIMLHFNWPTAAEAAGKVQGGEALAASLGADKGFEINSYIKINEQGAVTLFNPNPEFGQNVKTSLPMILAEELDVDWTQVTVEQADFYPARFGRQFTGGSQSIRGAWSPLRTAGATARQMLIEAAAKEWKVPAAEITTEKGQLIHQASGKKASYGSFASAAAQVPIPKEVKLKAIQDFKIIGSSQKNVAAQQILTGKPLFGLDYQVEGMLIAMIIHPPAFGLRFKSMDERQAKSMPGVKDIFTIDSLTEDIDQNFFDTTSFTKFVVIVGRSTWEVLQAKKAVQVTWEPEPARTFTLSGKKTSYPAGLESTEQHKQQMIAQGLKPGNILRRDGDPEAAFLQADKIIERTYTAPFLAHSTMEPVNCFANVKGDKADIYGPIQAPEFILGTLSQRLGIAKENIHIRLARMGGGFGRRAYGHHLVEAAVISQRMQAPVKLMYTREDEMTAGIYRPSYTATYRAALDKDRRLIAFHVKAGGVPETPVHANRFPAGTIDNYLAEGWMLPSNITIGAFRAPRSNFIAAAEQSFLDELSLAMGKDPIDFRLELLKRAQTNPVGKGNEYDAKRYAAVLELVREKSRWDTKVPGVFRGVSAYFCHNSYAAEVVDLVVEDNQPKVKQVVAAVDCGIVVNKDAAINMAEGAIIDGIGNALYGELTFKDGVPQKQNFTTYRLIRMNEAPKKMEIHFVENNQYPTGLGEPPFPPVFAAIANALFQATGKRYYNQPFINEFQKPLV